jgi:Heterokaryon incompatibility protein (HET)
MPKPSVTRLRTTTQNEVEASTLLRIMAYRKSHETLLEFARTNLAACLETHQLRCPTQASCLTGFLPTRLIDLRAVARPKLVRSRSIHSKDTRYACLSHQWGKPDMNARSVMTTLKSNLQSRLKGFRLENLPERYQEAMILCHLLGVRYIWIDSLCIIQVSRLATSCFFTNAGFILAAGRC